MNCIDCGLAADWVFRAAGVEDKGYCNNCLPKAYREDAAAGVGAVSPYVAPTLPVEEPAVVEPVVETKTTATKKKAADAEAPAE